MLRPHGPACDLTQCECFFKSVPLRCFAAPHMYGSQNIRMYNADRNLLYMEIITLISVSLTLNKGHYSQRKHTITILISEHLIKENTTHAPPHPSFLIFIPYFIWDLFQCTMSLVALSPPGTVPALCFAISASNIFTFSPFPWRLPCIKAPTAIKSRRMYTQNIF